MADEKEKETEPLNMAEWRRKALPVSSTKLFLPGHEFAHLPEQSESLRSERVQASPPIDKAEELVGPQPPPGRPQLSRQTDNESVGRTDREQPFRNTVSAVQSVASPVREKSSACALKSQQPATRQSKELSAATSPLTWDLSLSRTQSEESLAECELFPENSETGLAQRWSPSEVSPGIWTASVQSPPNQWFPWDEDASMRVGEYIAVLKQLEDDGDSDIIARLMGIRDATSQFSLPEAPMRTLSGMSHATRLSDTAQYEPLHLPALDRCTPKCSSFGAFTDDGDTLKCQAEADTESCDLWFKSPLIVVRVLGTRTSRPPGVDSETTVTFPQHWQEDDARFLSKAAFSRPHQETHESACATCRPDSKVLAVPASATSPLWDRTLFRESATPRGLGISRPRHCTSENVKGGHHDHDALALDGTAKPQPRSRREVSMHRRTHAASKLRMHDCKLSLHPSSSLEAGRHSRHIHVKEKPHDDCRLLPSRQKATMPRHLRFPGEPGFRLPQATSTVPGTATNFGRPLRPKPPRGRTRFLTSDMGRGRTKSGQLPAGSIKAVPQVTAQPDGRRLDYGNTTSTDLNSAHKA